MASKIDIFNMALQNLGSEPITSIAESQELSLRYEPVKRSLLEMHPWNFALKRAALNKSSESPAFGYANKFQLPSDFVRIVATKEQMDGTFRGDPSFNGYKTFSYSGALSLTDDYVIEAGYLLSDDTTKSILYVYDLEDTQQMSDMFVEVLAKALSADIAKKITGSDTEAEREKQELERLLSKAQTIDGQQGKIRRNSTSAWLGSRL